MRTFIRRPAARVDLIEIWIWSTEKWGQAKADDYLAAFDRAYLILAEHPNIGIDCSHIRKGLRRYVVEHHHVYYLEADMVIEIVRVLHERIVPDRRLDD